jgi:hypothetical protein
MRKVQLIAALSGLALFLALGATSARADDTPTTPKNTVKKADKKANKKMHRRHRGVITAVETDKDGNVISFTIARRHHKKNGKEVVRERKFTLDGSTRLAARGKMKKGFDASTRAKGQRVRILATGDHADKVWVRKLHTAKNDSARGKKVKNARAAKAAK